MDLCKEGRTPLHYATLARSHHSILEKLATQKCINKEDYVYKSTPLHLLVCLYIKPVFSMLCHMAMLQFSDSGEGEINPRMLEVLLEKGADIKAKNKAGETPIDCLAQLPIDTTSLFSLVRQEQNDPEAHQQWLGHAMRRGSVDSVRVSNYGRTF